MAELYYAIPFFVLLLVVEYLSFRSSGEHDGELVGFEARDTRTSLTMGLGNVVDQLRLEVRRPRRSTSVVYELTPLRLDPGDWWVWVLLFFADDLSYYWFHRISHESRVLLGEPRRPPLEPALQPLDRAAPDLGADDLLPVLAVDAARSASSRGWCCSRRPGR